MDDLPIYFDHVHGVYRLIDTDDTDDSGVEEIPFPSSFISEDDEAANTISESPTSKLFRTYKEVEEDDLSYVDDDRDKDYKPNQSAWHQKRGKCKPGRRPQGRPYAHHEMIMMTPEKQIGLHREPDSTQHCQHQQPIRHYARKDRTPRTILKMMERHRESERVRHHTLNESMKDVCLRVPGYDPAVKETKEEAANQRRVIHFGCLATDIRDRLLRKTKVIQMQRIIGYECFLENTLTSLCSQLGIPIKSLKLGTNFITDAMKYTPMEDFYKPSHYKTSDVEDDDCIVPVKKKSRLAGCKDIHNLNSDRNITRYRRHKISSPTVDSTTGDMVKVLTHENQPPSSRPYRDNLYPAQTFMPIDSSQESGIKVETQSIPDEETDLQEDIDTLIENGLYQDPDHLTSVTASFMKEEQVTTSAGNEDGDGFTLASPQHGNHSFIFLRSPPRAKGIWHASNVPTSDHYEAQNTSSEMQSVSPENILETKPKVSSTCMQPSSSLTRSASNPSHMSESTFIKLEQDDEYFTENSFTNGQSTGSSEQTVTITGLGNLTTSMSNLTGCVSTNLQHCSTLCADKRSKDSDSNMRREMMSPEKNKRKRYVPYRAPLLDLQMEQKKLKANTITTCTGKPDPTQTKSYSSTNNMRTLTSKKTSTVPPSRILPHAALKVDHRRATWMNGFMMFCQKNRAQIVKSNPGVHHSHIQKIMGHMWRIMSAEEQAPYREKAKRCSNYLKKVQNDVFTEFTESIVDSSLNEAATTVSRQ